MPGVNPVPANQNINDWINAAAFSQPDAFTYGDAPRTFSNLRAPHYINWDTAIQKYWNFSDSMRLQFRFEMFNSLNHPSFFAPDQNLGDAERPGLGRGSRCLASSKPCRGYSLRAPRAATE